MSSTSTSTSATAMPSFSNGNAKSAAAGGGGVTFAADSNKTKTSTTTTSASSSRRSALEYLSWTPSRAPIEVITLFFCLTTLVYFQLLHAIKDSDFFTLPASTSTGSSDSSAAPILSSSSSSAQGSSGATSVFLRRASHAEAGHATWQEVASAAFESGGGALIKQYRIDIATGDQNDNKDLLDAQVAECWGAYIDGSSTTTSGSSVVPPFQTVRVDASRGVVAETIRYEDVCYRDTTTSADCIKSHTQGPLVTLFFDRDPSRTDSVAAFLAGVEAIRKISVSGNDTIEVQARGSSAVNDNGALSGFEPSSSSSSSAHAHDSSSILTHAFFGAPQDVFAPSSGLVANRSQKLPMTVTDPSHTIRWMAYAVRALGTRFWILTKNADTADIFVVLLGYVLMHLTFVRLFLNMRKMGSSFWLPLGTLISSVFGFLFALFLAFLIKVPVDPITLSEALPFLVITVGFDKPFLLARAVFGNPEITPVQASQEPPSLPGDLLMLADDDALGLSASAGAALDDQEVASRQSHGALELDLQALDRGLAEHARMQLEIAEAKNRKVRWSASKPAKTIVLDAVARTGPAILRDYTIEVAVLLLGAVSGIGGLREFCQLAALILAMDCLCLFTFYAAILSVMVEVHRIKLVRRNTNAAKRAASSAQITPSASHQNLTDLDTPKKTFLQSVNGYKEALFGVKGANVAEGQEDLSKKQNPAVRLKLALIVSFLSLHLLNLCTTLTEQTALKRHHDIPSIPTNPAFDVAALAPVLSLISASFVEVLQPTFITSRFSQSSKMASLDQFMSEWTSLVGDPVLSKWIVVALFVSILLNGYLLKGLASVTVPDGTSGPVAVAAAAARLVGSGWDTEGMRREHKKRRWSGGIQLERWSANRRDLGEDTEERDTRVKVESLRKQNGHALISNGAPVEKLASTIPVHLPHPAPNKVIQSGDSTPTRLPEIVAPKPVRAVDAGHIIVPQTPTIPIAPMGEVSPVSQSNGFAGRRPLDECWEIFNGGLGALDLSDEEVIMLVEKGKVPAYALEKLLKDLERAVRVRRAVISRSSVTRTLENSELPMANYDYSRIIGACCENVVGYMPIPVGIAGPLIIDGISTHIPMATTEGTLVASTSRGAKALNAGGGVTTVCTADAMTRGPGIDFPSLSIAAEAKAWIEGEGGPIMKAAFESTSRFAKLQRMKCALAGRTLYIRFATSTGDAMGMNMISKGTEKALAVLSTRFPQGMVLGLSLNYCCDKSECSAKAHFCSPTC